MSVFRLSRRLFGIFNDTNDVIFSGYFKFIAVIIEMRDNTSISLEIARQMALALPGAVEMPHFDHPSFRANGKIFATLWEKENRMMVKLPLIEQSVFHSFDPAVFYPVPNKWGLKGATFVELAKVRRDMLEDALRVAWENVQKKNIV